MTKIQYCKNCKHLGHDGMFGLICDVNGDNTKYDCPKYEEDGDDGMTEKPLYDVINKAEPRGQSVTYEGIPCTARTCVTRLNRLTEENEQLKSALKELKEIGDYQADRIKELDEENQQIESTIKEAYNNERTMIGKSVLKQLIDKME